MSLQIQRPSNIPSIPWKMTSRVILDDNVQLNGKKFQMFMVIAAVAFTKNN